jgi:hypothetical protein
MNYASIFSADGLAFRAGWSHTPPARPVTQDHLNHPELILGLHGPGSADLKKSHHDDIVGDPYYVWSGTCSAGWALSFLHPRHLLNVGSRGFVRWRSRLSGNHVLRLVIQLDSGCWLISDCGDQQPGDWHEFEVSLNTICWHRLAVETMKMEDRTVTAPKAFVSAIGVADLSPSTGIDDCSRLDWFEAWCPTVERDGSAHRPGYTTELSGIASSCSRP